MKCPTCLGRQLVTAEGPTHAVARRCPRCTPECSLCGGRGYRYARDESGYTFARPCGCQKLERKLQRFNAARIPGRYHNASLFNFQERVDRHHDIVDYLDTWQRQFRPGVEGILLLGATGTGKTHLACALVRHVALQLGVAARFVDFFRLLADIREAYSNHSSEMALLGPLMNVPLLAIDELGKGKSGEWERGVLDQLISHRYNEQRTTVFTTNHLLGAEGPEPAGPAVLPDRLVWDRPEDLARLQPKPLLEERVGVRIFSRIREMCRPVILRGADDIRVSQWALDPLGDED